MILSKKITNFAVIQQFNNEKTNLILPRCFWITNLICAIF